MHNSVALRIALNLSLCMALASCGETGDAYYAGVNASPYPKADGPGEKELPNEIEAARRITAIIEAHLARLYPNGQVKRDAHPKATGCVDAVFTVNNDVPPAYRRGIFASPGTSYRAVIRFSNSNEDPKRSDANPDGRGMAIKLFDLKTGQIPITTDPLSSLSPRADNPAVLPDKMTSDNMALAGGPSQDFIMISHPTFLVADPDGYRRVLAYSDADNRLAHLMAPLAALSGLGLAGIKSATATTSLKIDNPLSIRYWSMVPYQLGDKYAMKFSADFVPEQNQIDVPDKSDPDFLRHSMSRTLQRREAKFVFEIQPIEPETSPELSVEDSRVEWPEKTAPFYPVAIIVIPKQNFDTVPRNTACELLSYSPWHALPEHKPLGAVNRMRKVIYETISGFRRQNASHVSP